MEERDAMTTEYLHIDYRPGGGWVLQIMERLLSSRNRRLRNAFEGWSDSPLRELGFAISTKMRILGRCLHRLEARVGELKLELNEGDQDVTLCLSNGYAFSLKDGDLPYELLLDMDSFIFETRSLYEIMGKFLIKLFDALFDRKVTEVELQSLLSQAGIDTRWIAELRENRKLFFHDTAPWLAVRVQRDLLNFEPILLKKQTTTFDPADLVDFPTIQAMYVGFANSAAELQRYVIEQIGILESRPDE